MMRTVCSLYSDVVVEQGERATTPCDVAESPCARVNILARLETLLACGVADSVWRREYSDIDWNDPRPDFIRRNITKVHFGDAYLFY